jgi:predicted 3-demethylubiquinone-9 3-methyltransferase (glyoxalase superfamily)
MHDVQYVSVSIDRRPADVYEFASDPRNLPRWARGLARSEVREVRDEWMADSPMGTVRIRFVPRNPHGVLDHDVTLESGVTVHNPMRVVRNGEGSELTFTLIRQPGMSDERLAADRAAVEADLRTLKELLERRPRPGAQIGGGTVMASTGRVKIFPHFWYAQEPEEAARFYAAIFPESRVDRVTALLSDTPSGPAGSVKVVEFTLFGQRFQAMSAGPHHEFNDAISMVVLCDDQAELDRYWSALLAGGGRAQACGWLIDRFGLRWQIVPAILGEMMRETEPARSKRVTDAMLTMVKLDIAAIERAYRS